MASADLDVVIVAYRCRDLLDACLSSLPAASKRRLAAVVVDNGSRDGTRELVWERYPAVRLVELGENAGFGRATNAGIRLGSAPYVLALNPDTRLAPGSLDTLLELLDARPEVGIVGCRLERLDGSFDHAARRSFPTVVGTIGHVSGLGRLSRAPRRLAQYRAVEVEAGPVDAVNGAFTLMRRAALDEVGLFDEAYWMYFEDLDLCKRFGDAGWTVWYEPSVSAVHVKHGTSGRQRSPRLAMAFHRSFLRFWRRQLADRHTAPVNALVYAGIALGLALAIVRWVAWRAARGR